MVAAATIVLLAVGTTALGSIAVAEAPVHHTVDELGPDARTGGPLNYVALGDSFTSGEGAPYVDPAERKRYPDQNADPDRIENDLGWLGDTGTDVKKLPSAERFLAGRADSFSFGGNNCHRSSHAYPARVWGALDQENPGWGVAFAACSGAKVEHFDEAFRGEPGQRGELEGLPSIDLVTLGFGGNDVGFGDIVACQLVQSGVGPRLTIAQYLQDRGFSDTPPDVSSCRAYFDLTRDAKQARLLNALTAMYNAVKERAPNARVIAVGYPRLFPEVPPGSCSLGSGGNVKSVDMRWLNDVADGLNDVIREAARTNRIDFVDTSGVIGAPDARGRHDFCVDDGSDRWVNRFIPSDLRRSMHPKFHYHEVVADRILACWRDEGTCNA